MSLLLGYFLQRRSNKWITIHYRFFFTSAMFIKIHLSEAVFIALCSYFFYMNNVPEWTNIVHNVFRHYKCGTTRGKFFLILVLSSFILSWCLFYSMIYFSWYSYLYESVSYSYSKLDDSVRLNSKFRRYIFHCHGLPIKLLEVYIQTSVRSQLVLCHVWNALTCFNM